MDQVTILAKNETGDKPFNVTFIHDDGSASHPTIF